MMGARIINRRPLILNAGWLDALDIQREGFKRSEDLRRSTGVSGKQLARESADHEFQIWWDYRGSDESALSRAEAKKEWLKGFRGRGWGSHNPPEESLQEKSWREWQENFVRVSADPENASITDLMRAIGYLDKVRSSIQRHAWDQGKKVDANVIAGYENEEQYYQRLIEQKQGRRRNAHGAIVGPGKYSVKILPRMGGDYFAEIRTPDGRYVDTHGLPGPDSVKSWIEKYVYREQHDPYDVLPALVWKPDKQHWGQYSTSFTVKR